MSLLRLGSAKQVHISPLAASAAVAMAHSLGPLLSPATNSAGFSSALRPSAPLVLTDALPINRRAMVLGLGGALWSLTTVNEKNAANAAARRPPPPPANEKKDPNVSGVQAKVLASKKRKEAMKAAMAKLRDKGKAIGEEPSSPASSSSSPQ